MTTSIFVKRAIMCLPLALLNLGKREAKRTGAVTGFVGVLVILGSRF